MCGLTGMVIAASGGGASPGNASEDQYKPPKCKSDEEPDGDGNCQKKADDPLACKSGETEQNGKCVTVQHSAAHCRRGYVQKHGRCVKKAQRPKCRHGRVWKKGHGRKHGHCVKKKHHKRHPSGWHGHKRHRGGH